MKKLLILILFSLIVVNTNAQYKINKAKYNYSNWTHEESDPYNPTVCGVLSFVVPGVGQMAAGEFGRGAAFFGGCAGCFAFTIGGFSVAWGSNEDLGVAMMIAGLAGMVAVDIWSIVDAVRVAKVNNLVWRDKNSTGFNIQLEPFIIPTQTYMSTITQAGLSLKVNF